MATIGEQIVAARRAKGMTQDELARAMSVSTQTISRWEEDRSMPDAEALPRLSQALDYRFEDATEESGDQASLPESQKGPFKGRWILAGSVAAVLLCAALVVVLPMVNHPPENAPAATKATEVSRLSKTFYQRSNPEEDGRAYLTMSCQLETENADGDDGLSYTLTAHEQHGLAFAVDKLETYLFVQSGVAERHISAKSMKEQGQSVDVAAHGDWSIAGGMPLQDAASGIGFVLTGADENGAELSFVLYQPLE